MSKRCQNVKKMSKCQKDVKMSKRCQNVKMSKRCQMSISQTHRLWRRFTKKINSHNEVKNFDVKYEGHQNCSKILSMHILRVFGHHHM